MATIHFRFYGPIRNVLKKDTLEYEVSPGRPLRDILLEIGVPQDHLVYTMVLVNDRKTDVAYVPSDGDRIDVFQPVGGGKR